MNIAEIAKQLGNFGTVVVEGDKVGDGLLGGIYTALELLTPTPWISGFTAVANTLGYALNATALSSLISS